ncbi:XRE family transcriptional regulator [Umezawaea endophytica]|uniref:XRE family transcriptional regulator n=1 Tax=Umezawaea endophytica TaxID=1654476 RepID=A0A9X2VHX3_9PSEU|nr:XRE family transcriptional regulator [Umezawaea endophytica]MCS7477065.1 XRE family transcriptional regulator [Umezawaea endophytica]
MPRLERPLAGEDTPVLRFAEDLRRLRRVAGLPSYRELGRLANYSPAALSEAVAGRRLPSLAVTRAFVRACGGDVEGWTARWRELAVEEPDHGDAPYVGLAAYQVADAERFFGREADAGRLLALVRERPFVGLFGASGAGKSSLLRAGLAARWGEHVVITPGPDPITELAAALAGHRSAVEVRAELAADPEHLRVLLRQAGDGLLLVVDQFEEAFTLCEEADRLWLVRALTHGAGAARVVIGVRADFYGHCARHPELVEALHRSQSLVGPMSAEQLRRAVVEPAALRGVSLENSLVARLVADVAGWPGALPLASHVLVETWRRRRGSVLTLAAYEDAGGVEHALARTADQVHDAFSDQEKQAAREVFQRLVAPGDGTGDTRRRVVRAELDAGGAVLDRLAAARLVTLDRDTVELTHEALLRAWPRLVGWLDEDRESLRAHRRLTVAADTWRAHDRDPDVLYRGVHLDQARRLAPRLNAAEREFVDASATAEREREAHRRRGVRRLRRLVACLAVLVLLLAATATYAVTAQRAATRERNQALSSRAADTALGQLTRPREAAALALAAYRVAPTARARDAILLARAAGTATTLGEGYARVPGVVVVTNEVDAESTAAAYRLWVGEGADRRRAGRIDVPPGGYLYLLSADGRTALTTVRADEFELWDIGDPDAPRRTATMTGWPMPLGVDGAGTLMTAVEDGEAVHWRPGDTTRVRLPGGEVESAVPLVDGTGVVVVRRDGDRRAVEVRFLDGRTTQVLSRAARLVVVAGPRGRLAVSDLDGGHVTVLDVAAGPRTLLEADGVAGDAVVEFSRDGGAVTAVRRDSVWLWDLDGGREPLSLRGPGVEFGDARYDPGSGELLVLPTRGGALWRLAVEVDRVIREVCADPADVDWDAHFPGVPRRPLCP